MEAKTQSLAEHIEAIYQERFGEKPLLVRSPGRINLIGEHTDYNGGFVLPAAIDKAVYIAVGVSGDDSCRYYAVDLNESYQDNIRALTNKKGHWSAYINGVVDQLHQQGLSLRGFNLVVGGDVPVGAGLSSSAALECGVSMALNELFGLGLDKITMVKLSQRAENEYVGMKCGIMDQFASMMGKEGHVIRLDCRSLEFQYEPFDSKEYDVVLLDTGVKHSLASSEYNTRREECEKGVALIAASVPGVKLLRDVTVEMLDRYVKPVDENIYRKCLYVVEEIRRLTEGCEDLRAGDIRAFGKKMFATHEGLSRFYKVSCDELDFLVDAVRENPHVAGARMMGGGFGGCTINLIRKEARKALVTQLKKAYSERFGKVLTVIDVRITDGTTKLN